MKLRQSTYLEWVNRYRAELEEEFQRTEPNLEMVKCLECYGKGYRECDLGHEHDCEECDGQGKIEADSFEDFAYDAYQTQSSIDHRRAKEYEQCLSQS